MYMKMKCENFNKIYILGLRVTEEKEVRQMR